MTESEIPADIWKTAEEVFERGSTYGIALALLAERKAQQTRAATILSGIADVMTKHMVDQATPELLTALSNAIRQDNPNGT